MFITIYLGGVLKKSLISLIFLTHCFCLISLDVFPIEITTSIDFTEISIKNNSLGMANPATVYCKGLGYEHKSVKNSSGEYGLCVFPDKTECEQWKFLNGECGQNFSYCAQNGLSIETRNDGKNSLSPKYAVCFSKDKNQENSISSFMNLSDKATVGILKEQKYESLTVYNGFTKNLPLQFDWRNNEGINYVTPVKDQFSCGSCWAFAANAAVESAYNVQIDNNINRDLSEQELISCSSAGDCGGGSSGSSLNYIRDFGITNENCFPYAAADIECERCPDYPGNLTGIFDHTTIYGIEDIKEALIDKGPLTAALSIHESHGGYWDGDIYRCDESGFQNHAVTIVGYDEIGQYWIVKNSWGSNWNGDGYFKVGYDECHINDYAGFINTAPNDGSACEEGFFLLRKLGANWDGTVTIPNQNYDEACCDDPDTCVINGECYEGGSGSWDFRIHEIEYGTNKKLGCNTQGINQNSAWFNLDYSWYSCERDGGFKWRLGSGDANIESGYNPDGNFNDSYYCKDNLINPIGPGNPSTECCCGDDIGEFYIVNEIDGSEACCDQENECVLNGVCQNHTVESSERNYHRCKDGIDNDCNGLTDCQEPNCFNVNYEICFDGKDNDCDGLTDCLDPDCDGRIQFDFSSWGGHPSWYVDVVESPLNEYSIFHTYYIDPDISTIGQVANVDLETISYDECVNQPNSCKIRFIGFDGSLGTLLLETTFAEGVQQSNTAPDVQFKKRRFKIPLNTISYNIDKIRIEILTNLGVDYTSWYSHNFAVSDSCGNGICAGYKTCDPSLNIEFPKCSSYSKNIIVCNSCDLFGDLYQTCQIPPNNGSE